MFSGARQAGLIVVVIIVIIVIIGNGLTRKFPTLFREVLKSYIAIVELCRNRSFGIQELGKLGEFPAFAFEGDDYALLCFNVVEIDKTPDSCLHGVGNGDGIHGPEAEIHQSITGNDSTFLIQSFEENRLIHREFKVRAQLLVESIKRIQRIHSINSEEAFETGQSDSIFIYHTAILKN